MSEFAPSAVSGDNSVHAQAGLTPEASEEVLADFRAWLRDAAQRGTLATSLPPVPEEEQIDLHTLLGQFIALRHEVNLQTKAARSQQEQNAEILGQMGQALTALGQAQAAVRETGQSAQEEQLRPILKTLVDVYDALSLAGREAQKAQGNILAALEQLPNLESAPAKTTALGLWFGRRRPEEEPHTNQEWRQHVQQTSTRVRQFLDSLLTGYTMSLRRVERALEPYHLEPIPCVGRPFDPEQMEVVEAVAGSGRPAGEVLEEVRRGYLWQGRVFRYAQVRVAKG